MLRRSRLPYFTATSMTRSPAFSRLWSAPPLHHHSLSHHLAVSFVSEQYIIDLVRALPDKKCTSDHLPTWLLKDNIDLMAPFLCCLINSSLSTLIVPGLFKSAYVTPLLKKADLDSADVKSYRPILNLSVISKLLERTVAKQLIRYLKDSLRTGRAIRLRPPYLKC